MGNICGASGSHHVYSPPASPRYASGPSSPVRSAGGQVLTLANQLSDEERDKFLNIHDPMRKLGLDSETPLYRTMDKQYVREGMVAGHSGSLARIALHEELMANPFAQELGIPEGASCEYAYWPKQGRASDLPDPSLNVMVGPDARDAISGYKKENHVTLKMRLGDFLEKGGKVYRDVSSVSSNNETSTALIVTLPKGHEVPATVVSD